MIDVTEMYEEEGPAVLTVRIGKKVKYVCQQCKRAFSYMNGAVEHVKRAHMGVVERHVCECGKTFTWKTAYVKHRKVFGH